MVRRRLMAQSMQEGLDFEYAGEISANNQYGRVSINFQAENDTVYLVLSKDRSMMVFVNVRRNAYAFLAYAEGIGGAGIIENNYTLTDGKVGISPKIGDNVIETLALDLYKRRLTQE